MVMVSGNHTSSRISAKNPVLLQLSIMDEHQRRFRYARQTPQRSLPRQQAQPTTVRPTVATPQPNKGIYINFSRLGSKLPKLNKVNLALAVAVVAALAVAGFFYNRYQDARSQLNQHDIISPQQQQANKDKISEIVARVGKLTVLPQGETPTLAEVTDISKLVNQPFFAKAQNGDEVLIYTGAKTAYLYRPSTNQLINVAPVTQGDTSSSGSSGIPPNSQTSTSGQAGGN